MLRSYHNCEVCPITLHFPNTASQQSVFVLLLLKAIFRHKLSAMDGPKCFGWTEIIKSMTNANNSIDMVWYDIFVICNCDETWLQAHNTHLHNTQNNTMKQNTQHEIYITIRIRTLYLNKFIPTSIITLTQNITERMWKTWQNKQTNKQKTSYYLYIF